MNFKHETYEWGGYDFIRVSKKRFENFIRFFENRIEGNHFMGWNDWYDWSLNGNLEITAETPEDIAWDNLEKCNVAREYCDPDGEYWLRVDYIKANNYDLDTIVPKPREKRLTKKEKELAKLLAATFDKIFELESKKAVEDDK